MNFTWLLPSALAALAALALPLLIHLSRRAEHKLTDFAALRWLSIHQKPQRKWLLQERVLLAIRLLLLIVLAFFLAQPVLMTQTKPAHWVVVAPGANIADLKQRPSGKNVEWHWLSPGYPAFDQAPPSPKIALSSLLRELDSQLPKNTELTVLVPEKLAGLDGRRIQLSRKITWRVVPGEMKISSPIKTFKPIHLVVRYDVAHENSVAYFRAAQHSWSNQQTELDIGLLTDTPPKRGRVLVWLASGKLPPALIQWLQQGGTLIASKELSLPAGDYAFPVWRDANSAVLLREWQAGSGRILQWQMPLTPAKIPMLLDGHFPEQLLAILNPSRTGPAIDFASQQSPQKDHFSWPEAPKPMLPWLVFLIVLLFAIERWLSAGKKTWIVL